MTDRATIIRPSARVLKAVQAREWIGEIDALRATRRRAERRMEAARRAWRRAKASGRREGREEGTAEAATSASHMLCAIRAERERAERDLPGIVAAIVERVLGRYEPDEFVSMCVREAMGEHADRGRATLSVPAALAADIAERLSDLGDTVAVAPDDRLDGDRSLLVFGDAVLELGLEAQMRALRAGLPQVGSDVS